MLQTSGPILVEGVKQAWGFITANEYLTFLVGCSLAMCGLGLFAGIKSIAKRH